jgi:AraC-like DNA-binding protein/L-amino acid N-acyltransferase YncA
MRKNIEAPLTLSDIANHAGYSVYHFSREFYKETGYTVMEFFRKEKIKASSAKLTESKSIYDCALSYGFDTPAGYTNAFYNVTGCSPSEYKKHEMINKNSINYIRREIIMENSSLVIRLIEMKDINDMWENVFSRNTPEEIKQRIQRDLDAYENKTGFHVVAEVDKKVIGTLGLGRYSIYSKFANSGDFVIHPCYQGKGIARKLLEKTIELAKQFNIDTLMIQTGADTKITCEKYISLGFTKVFESGGLIYLMMAIN